MSPLLRTLAERTGLCLSTNQIGSYTSLWKLRLGIQSLHLTGSSTDQIGSYASLWKELCPIRSSFLVFKVPFVWLLMHCFLSPRSSPQRLTLMNAFVCAVLFFLVTAQAVSALDTSGKGAHRAIRNVVPVLEGSVVCATAQIQYTWNSKAEGAALLTFFKNGTFYDNTYNKYGPWWNIQENSNNIFFWNYPGGSVYVSPTNQGKGSMITENTGICGSWYSPGWKWLCEGSC